MSEAGEVEVGVRNEIERLEPLHPLYRILLDALG